MFLDSHIILHITNCTQLKNRQLFPMVKFVKAVKYEYKYCGCFYIVKTIFNPSQLSCSVSYPKSHKSKNILEMHLVYTPEIFFDISIISGCVPLRINIVIM